MLRYLSAFVPGMVLLGCCWGATAWADDAQRSARNQAAVDFQRDILPIFATHCDHCHGPDDQQAQLRLDARRVVFEGGVSGPAIKPGDSAGSLLVQRLLGAGNQERMPPDDDPLPEETIALVRRWIDSGAVWPDGVGLDTAEVRRHWAYQPPERPALPPVADEGWCRNEIDRFILARLEQAELTPSPEADRARLLRRVSLDLIGLPPTVEAVDAFLADTRPDAFERAVDDLLASPRFGERWAVAWLDGARYADSNGFQRDGHRVVWPYRDWVIDALNADMPFDRFTIEQLAGDLLPEATESSRIATGFHRCTTVNVEAGVDQEENRTNQVIDRVNVTGTIWLGSTLECAQCHNHKYDPFTQRDYYRLFAYFNNTQIETTNLKGGATLAFTGPMMELEMPGDLRRQRQALERELVAAEASLEQAESEALADFAAWQQAAAAALGRPESWHVMRITEFTSAADDATYELLDDGSLLVRGTVPDRDTYRLTAETVARNITAIKLETLTHPSLPGQGPGRGHAERPNFILNQLRAAVAPLQPAAPAAEVRFTSATADLSQRGWDVAGAIDGDPRTGWGINPGFHQPHHAVFALAKPIDHASGSRWTITLEQLYGGGRTIGRLRLLAREGAESNLPEAVAGALRTDEAQRTRAQRTTLRKHFLDHDARVAACRADVERINKQLARIRPPTSLVMVETDQPRDTNIFVRGNFLEPGEPVEPGTPAVLHRGAENLPPNRLGLAQWLVSQDNPLVARVTVNRWWAELFGQGIVPTLEDLGSQSEPATHPELLDWLAVEFAENGWSTKHVLRLIVTSAAYRQSAAVSPALLRRDPYNKLYARGPRMRLPAEFIRDNALAIAGLLSDKLGGPPVYPPQPAGIWRVTGDVDNNYRTSQGEDRYRRGVYTVWRRSSPYPSFVAFDAPDRSACVVARARTNTPLQALTLLNDPVYVEAAAALAVRIIDQRPSAEPGERVVYGFRRCVARTPSQRERAYLEQMADAAIERYAADPAAARAVVAGLPASDQIDWRRYQPVELAAWLEVASTLLNLDETIVK